MLFLKDTCSHPHLAETQINKYESLLRENERNWEFGDTKDYMLQDKIVFSVTDKRVKDQLLRELGLSLQKAIDICNASEVT